MLDILIKNGLVIDGLNTRGVLKDVGIEGDKIVEVGDLSEVEANKVIDASGLCVAPGFIDMHTHSDEAVLLNPLMESKIRQGVTTEVIGNCGSSAAPLMGEALKQTDKLLSLHGFPISWKTMGEYLDLVQERGSSTNIIALTGHGNLRGSVMGFGMRAPTIEEMKDMKEVLESTLKEGSWGLTTGLIYPPSSYAETREIIELAKVVTRYDGIYATHMRNETDKLLEAVEETLNIGRESSVKVEIAHHKAAGKSNWGRVEQSLSMIEKARNSGIDVTCDQYPYIAASTGLSSRIPDWAHDGGVDKMVERLKTPETSARILDDIKQKMPDKNNYEAVLIASCPSDKSLEGLNLWQISEKQNLPPQEVIVKLLIENDGLVDIVSFGMCEEDVKRVMKTSFIMIGSDAGAKATYGPLSEGKPHPRAYGTFPRVLGKYSREERVISLEEAIYKMTGLPAKTLGLSRRGVINKGNYADLVIFDANSIIDRATYVNPHQYPVGIDFVLVNGAVTIEKGEHKGVLAGKVLRSKSD
ncbi:MAG: D-aminoacylase [candidate division WS2 bacterium]|nr:D-aminoacylase [Candidatus Lithacetigena glycinireducens]